jgi:hypothetical protein
MSRTFCVNIKNKASEETNSTRVSIPDDEWSSLVEFASCAEEILTLRPFQEGLAVNVRISYSKESGFEMQGMVPCEETVALMLHKVRPFILHKKEPLSFYRIRNILAKHLTSSELQITLEHQKDLFSGKDFNSQLRIATTSSDHSGVLNSDDSFNKWLNGYEYHRDEEKRVAIQQLCGVLPFGIGRAILISMLLDKVRAILNVAEVIRCCEKADGSVLHLSRPSEV